MPISSRIQITRIQDANHLICSRITRILRMQDVVSRSQDANHSICSTRITRILRMQDVSCQPEP